MKFVCWIVALCGLAGSCYSIDREAFVFTNYNLDVRVEPAQQRLGVRGKVTLRNESTSPQKHAVLQISSSLDWRSIQISGKPIQFVSQHYTSDIDHTGALSEAIVTLPREVPAKGTVELEVGYEGVVPLDSSRIEHAGVGQGLAKQIEWDQISAGFTGVRGIGHVTWFPISSEAVDFSEGRTLFDTVTNWKNRHAESTMSLRLSVPDNNEEPALIILANAPDCKAMDVKNGEHAAVVECLYHPIGVIEPPMFLVARWTTLVGGNAVVFYLPGHEPAAQANNQTVEKTAPFLREWFGPPRTVAHIADTGSAMDVPFDGGGPLMLAPLSLSADERRAEITLVHTLTRATFDSSRPWIGEGLAHFAQALWIEHQSGRQAALDFMGQRASTLTDGEKAAGRGPDSARPSSLITTADETFYRSKAMFVWWMLRDLVGEPALKKALAAYHAEDDKDPTYMPRLIEAQGKRDLSWFLNEWVYHDRGLPDFRVASAYPRPTGGGAYLVTVSIENLGMAGAEVPVTVRTAGGEVTKRLEVRGNSTAAIRIEVPSAPQEVVVNDGSVPESNVKNNAFKIEVRASKPD